MHLVGTFLYYFVIAGGWYVLSKAKKLSKYNPEIVRYIIVGKILIISELAAGLSMPTHLSKGQAILSGIWLGIVWYIRLWTKEQMLYQHSSEIDFQPDSHFMTSKL